MNKKQNYTVVEAQKKLEYYCAYQDRSHVEVITKLKEMGMIPEARDKIVADLIRANYPVSYTHLTLPTNSLV